MKELHERVGETQTREDLAALIEALRVDLATRPENWENATLESFLAALASWTEDMDGYYRNHGREAPDVPTWRTFGEMLVAARNYE
jgi:hypothetical protein